MNPRSTKALSLAGLLAGLAWTTPQLTAQPPVPEITDLIVLVAAMPEAPEPESLVLAVNNQDPIPGGFGTGDPVAAELVVKRRATGTTRAWMEANPDMPLARLERYVVLTYPPETDLDAVAAELAGNPYVENVEPNVWLRLSGGTGSLPSDPLIDPTSGDPSLHQWGSHLLNLPAAWQHATGHAWVGLIDTGLEVDHPDLRTYSGEPDVDLAYEGGNLREHLSEDIRFDDCNVDELDPQDDGFENRDNAGHGTHVSGIVAGTTDNDIGIAGSCWHCSLMMARAFTHDDPAGGAPDFQQSQIDKAVDGFDILMEQGPQILSMSFGVAEAGCPGGTTDLSSFCQAIALAEERDVVLVASAGNDKTAIEFPANDPRVISVGGVEPDAGSPSGFAFWDEAPNCPDLGYPNQECGSNFGPEQDLAAPAKTVLSTMYAGFDVNSFSPCGDSYLSDDGYGPCTGTSMSAPYVAGIAGILRSVNPLLKKDAIRDALISTASQAGAHEDQLGYGVPDAEAAVRRVLGTAGGEVLANRLTPLFSLYSEGAQTHVYTTFPPAALAFLFDRYDPFEPVGPPVPGYTSFGSGCTISPCTEIPRASVYLFTSQSPPFPGAPELVPLYRLRYDPNLPDRCAEPQPPHVANRDFSYTTTAEGVVHFKEDVTDSNGIGYELDGIEGYIYPLCEPDPECIPEGAERLYRLYHPLRDDYAIFPHRELDAILAEGYEHQDGLADWIGYAYPNDDGDGDELIDGFELLIGTDPANADTDCDGVSDGDEVHDYDLPDPDPANHGYGDPLVGSCLFLDGFESGDTSLWSATQG